MIRQLGKRSVSHTRMTRLFLFPVAVVAAWLVCGNGGYGQAQLAPYSDARPTASAPLPPPQVTPPYDVSARSQAILAHLNAVLRFYRESEAPIQRVGEPSDLYYRNEAVTQATRIAGFGFQSAKAEVGMIDRFAQASGGASSHTQRVQQALNNARQRITELKTQDAQLDRQIASATGKKRALLQQQLEQVDGELDLQNEMVIALNRIAGMASLSGEKGLGARVAELERSAPGVVANKATTAAPTLENLTTARGMGVFGQARIVFDLLHAREAINSLADQSDVLHDQAVALRAPLITALKNTIAEGQAASQNAGGPNAPSASAAAQSAAETEKKFRDLTASFKVLSSAAVPLSQEIMALEQNQAGLQAWSAAVDQEYDTVLQALLLRVLFIVIALGIILGISELWRRGTKRYVRDVRRRRQLLVLRRFVTGFLVGLVLIFGLVTQFSSLATFAGLITAGIAVGLQTVLLSIAAYFFIVGRYGIKAGDRITIAGVTGDVVEVGLLRFYVMEMAGSGTDLYSSGRVAVFSNAVLFQATTPLYKQMPGTEFAWHELVVKLRAEADYRPVAEVVLKVIQQVYDEYRQKIEQQHKKLEAWVDSNLDAPAVVSSLQLADGGPELRARFPVMIRYAGTVDDKITEMLMELLARDPKIKLAISESPVIRAAVRG